MLTQTDPAPFYAVQGPDGEYYYLEGGDLFAPGELRRTNQVVQQQNVKVLAPVVPPAIFCIGLNYQAHAEETGKEVPKYPIIFMKNPVALQNPDDPILLPDNEVSTAVDYECELTAVIGRRCKNVTVEEALDYVLGFTCGNDVSARDWQSHRGGGQWVRAKSFDTFCPLGPCLVTRDEIGDPQNLKLQTRIGTEVLQDSTTADMIFSVAELISFLSQGTTLLPGSIILTGTPPGVGVARKPPRYLQAGEEVTVEIENIGPLTNPVLSSSASTPW